MTMVNWIVELQGYNPDTPGVETQYFCSSPAMTPFPDGDADRPNQYYQPRVKQPGNISRYMFDQGTTTGIGRVGYGEVVLSNADGGLDDLLDWGFDGRQISIKYGGLADEWTDYTAFMVGTVEQVEFSFNKSLPSNMIIRVRDLREKLDQPIQTTRYGGTNSSGNGVDGTADDIKDQVIPLAYGKGFNARPRVVNAGKLIMQIHDGAIQAVDAVYDGQVALTFNTDHADAATLEAASVPGSNYDTCLAEGLIKVGSTPQYDITVDFQGSDTGGTYVSTVADIVERILEDQAGLSSSEIDATSFSALNTANSSVVGIYIDRETTILQVISELLSSIGAAGYFCCNGVFHVARLEAPTGTADYTITDGEFIDIEKLPTADKDVGLPAYRVNVHYQKVNFVQSGGLVAPAAPAARKAIVEQPYRTAQAETVSVLTKHLLSPEIDRYTLLTSASDAAAEASRLQTLYGTQRDRYIVTIARNLFDTHPELNDIVTLQLSRFGLSSGKKFVVLGVTDVVSENRIELELWG